MPQLRPRLLSAAVALALSLSAVACAEPLTLPEPGTVLFEVELINSAWGQSWHGFVVEADGRVYSYDLGDSELWPPPVGDDFTADWLETKYSHGRRLVGAVSAAEAAARYARVSDALRGGITEALGVCADAGTVRYSALLYEPALGRYRRILLHQRGDVAQTNTSSAARELYLWLAEVTSTEAGDAGCDPYG
jgi:hypothetical protein